jgi:hypothetical protein
VCRGSDQTELVPLREVAPDEGRSLTQRLENLKSELERNNRPDPGMLHPILLALSMEKHILTDEKGKNNFIILKAAVCCLLGPNGRFPAASHMTSDLAKVRSLLRISRATDEVASACSSLQRDEVKSQLVSTVKSPPPSSCSSASSSSFSSSLKTMPSQSPCLLSHHASSDFLSHHDS